MRNSPSASRVISSAASQPGGAAASRSWMARRASAPELPNSHQRSDLQADGETPGGGFSHANTSSPFAANNSRQCRAG